jgi:outer membrane protein OmpA-like peptidoglycan-associated protein
MRRRATLAAFILLPAGLLTGCAANGPAATASATEPVRVVFFEEDSVEISPPAMDVIQAAAVAARRRPADRVLVSGFIAPDPVNAPTTTQALRLSRVRADRVAAELAGLGVPRDRIEVRGRGVGNVVDLPLEARRVEIRVGGP